MRLRSKDGERMRARTHTYTLANRASKHWRSHVSCANRTRPPMAAAQQIRPPKSTRILARPGESKAQPELEVTLALACARCKLSLIARVCPLASGHLGRCQEMSLCRAAHNPLRTMRYSPLLRQQQLLLLLLTVLRLDIANGRMETRWRPVVFGRALPWLKRVDLGQRRRLAHPLQHLPVGHKEYVL